MRHGSHLDPPNRFESLRRYPDLEHLEWDDEYRRALTHRRIEYLEDDSQTIVSENQSPDIPFRYSLNPYRGCAHGCAYCYARPGHEFLGMNAGMDFETRIVVKKDAPRLFQRFLSRKRWRPEPITFSGVTDCYQPAEREFRLTRQCLEVALRFRQPISIVTKNALILRDVDLLTELALLQLVHVYLSITSLDTALARDMEPRTSIPSARLRAVRELAQAGVPTGVLTAPIIPGLNDSEIPTLLDAAREVGATSAGYILLRLPLTVEPVFIEWLQRTRPDEAEKVLQRMRQSRGGQLNSSAWVKRMSGWGAIADQIGDLFRVFRSRCGLDQPLPPHNCDLFEVPSSDDPESSDDPQNGPRQLRLF